MGKTSDDMDISAIIQLASEWHYLLSEKKIDLKKIDQKYWEESKNLFIKIHKVSQDIEKKILEGELSIIMKETADIMKETAEYGLSIVAPEELCNESSETIIGIGEEQCFEILADLFMDYIYPQTYSNKEEIEELHQLADKTIKDPTVTDTCRKMCEYIAEITQFRDEEPDHRLLNTKILFLILEMENKLEISIEDRLPPQLIYKVLGDYFKKFEDKTLTSLDMEEAHTTIYNIEWLTQAGFTLQLALTLPQHEEIEKEGNCIFQKTLDLLSQKIKIKKVIEFHKARSAQWGKTDPSEPPLPAAWTEIVMVERGLKTRSASNPPRPNESRYPTTTNVVNFEKTRRRSDSCPSPLEPWHETIMEQRRIVELTVHS